MPWPSTFDPLCASGSLCLDVCSWPHLKPWPSCGFQLFGAAVVAVDQQQMKPQGLFIAGWPWGLEQGPRPGESHWLLVRDRGSEMDEALGFCVPLGG